MEGRQAWPGSELALPYAISCARQAVHQPPLTQAGALQLHSV